MHYASQGKTVRSISCTLFSLLFLSLVSTSLAQETAVIVGATLIDGTGREPVPDSAIVIEGSRIVAVGPRSQVRIPAGAQVVDATSKFVTPGLIDVNVHLILMIEPEFYVKYEDRLEEIVIESAQIALKYGVTTVRDSWSPLEPLLRARDRINRGETLGARMLVAGNIVGVGGPFSEYFLHERGAGIPLLFRKGSTPSGRRTSAPRCVRRSASTWLAVSIS